MLLSDSEMNSGPEVEMAHTLYMDIVEYSRLDMEHQQSYVRQLTEVVRESPEFQEASAGNQLICLPSGDGMSLVFFGKPEPAIKCAVSITRLATRHPQLRFRMGIHTGPVYRIRNITGQEDVAGAGINMAARVMECGDTGHILLSGSYAEILLQLGIWRARLHELGECAVKHGARVRIFSLYFDDVGNPAVPVKLSAANKVAARSPAPATRINGGQAASPAKPTVENKSARASAGGVISTGGTGHQGTAPAGIRPAALPGRAPNLNMPVPAARPSRIAFASMVPAAIIALMAILGIGLVAASLMRRDAELPTEGSESNRPVRPAFRQYSK